MYHFSSKTPMHFYDFVNVAKELPAINQKIVEICKLNSGWWPCYPQLIINTNVQLITDKTSLCPETILYTFHATF